MRLLTHDKHGGIVLETFDGIKPPPYAILSHTWYTDNSEEVTFQDLQGGRAKNKPGYNKILFCELRAAADELEYFWIDTCCIDKSSSAELSESLNSMFRWYKQSTKCYVYLTDVSHSDERMFRNSRWFTRGWTLQELVAPKVVEFFALDKSRLGDRSSLETTIHEITGIAVNALRGHPLSSFGVEERFRWASRRQTRRPEDKAYSLLGIFNIFLPVIYGEGEESALLRLREQVDKSISFVSTGLANISLTDTRKTTPPATLPTSPRVYYLPFHKNKRFVGRHDELKQLRQKLLVDQECREIAVVGLGGIGKTQVALEFAQWVKREALEYSVFWVSAVSLESFEQSCTEIARLLQIPRAAMDGEDVKELVRQRLNGQTVGKWLLVVDNADDMDLLFGAGSSSGIKDFLPENEDGIILFTSRSQEVANALVGSDVLKINKMSEEEAVTFMMASLGRENKVEDGAIKQLVAELDYLPLAIAQAVAYINVNEITVLKYLGLIQNTDADLIAVMSREFRDNTRYKQSGNAVATTWIVSFKQILRKNADAADLLSFISCIEWKGIPLSMLPIIKPEARMIDAMGTICSYGFLTEREDEHVYDMHRLVHLALRIWMARDNREADGRQAAIKHMADVFPFGGYENRDLWRAYLPHALRLMTLMNNDDTAAKTELALCLGCCLEEDGRCGQAVIWLEKSCEWREKNLDEDDADRLLSQHQLAIAYKANGQIEQAVALLEHVVAVEAKLAEDHPSRLASQHALAGAYKANGQIEQAVALLEHVVAAQAKLAEDHPSRLASQHALAGAYKANGQIEQAVALLEHVVAVKAKLAEDHPSRLASQHALAGAYKANGQIEQAVALLEHVVAVKAKLAEDHPSRLASQHALAGAYKANGQIEQAVALLEHVVAVKRRRYADTHPSRIVSEELLRKFLRA